MTTLRTFYRCPQCLIIATLETRPSRFPYCDNCKTAEFSAQLEFLGSVVKDRLVNEIDRCPCDDRCTSATGPNCECLCGGENHGKGWITVVIDVGGMPSVTQAPKARENLAAWHDFNDCLDSALTHAKQIYGDDFTRYCTRAWINNRQTWNDLYCFFSAIGKTKKLRSHHGRVKAIEKLRDRLALPRAA